MNHSIRYAALATGVTLSVCLIGLLLAEPAAARGVWFGALLALLFQVGIVAVLSPRLGPEDWLLSFVIRFLGRLVLIVAFAVGLWTTGVVPLAPALLSLGVVLYATTVMEPIVFHARAPLHN